VACREDGKPYVTDRQQKRLRWFGGVRSVDRTRILRKASALKFEGNMPTERPITRWLSQVLEDV
jgi:hypothetical protein